MIKQAYIKGFLRKCAECGVDGKKLLKNAGGGEKIRETHPAFSEDYGEWYKNLSRGSSSSPFPLYGYPTSIFSAPNDGLALSALFDEHGRALPTGSGGLTRGPSLGSKSIRKDIAKDLWHTDRLAGSWWRPRGARVSRSLLDGGTLTPALRSAVSEIALTGTTKYNPRLAGTGGGKNGFIYGR